MTALKVVMFLGTVRENRIGLRVAKFIERKLKESNHNVTVFDPVELDLPLLTKPVFHYQDRADAPSKLVECEKTLKAADAIVLVSAEYNHSIPPALSNLIDYFGASSYSYKPSGIVCYSMGQYGGMRAAMQLRSMLGEIGSLSTSYIFGVPKAHQMFDEEGNPLNDYMNTSYQKFITQLDWYANALRNHRESVGTPN
ncbi:Chromate reductase [Trichoplax sp. H2]|uniref:NADPH-dependent FMN reductase-like domain-containing protein n=1 Tax=Trichoplax adhaerens TaxID=10228 RepID=B3S9X1_TRIAD|nr:expressed hypothetical protein [Trichoplax adhaerens]EDV20410.1 expressed hypothetical protein [Trichoplax adhaerens]RDD38402.1 Chromate reductase [Trichoplax sp. H2]|eukprot:XP_002117104.1 expressed hypothetical protein [Trichoplax adhaerens]